MSKIHKVQTGEVSAAATNQTAQYQVKHQQTTSKQQAFQSYKPFKIQKQQPHYLEQPPKTNLVSQSTQTQTIQQFHPFLQHNSTILRSGHDPVTKENASQSFSTKVQIVKDNGRKPNERNRRSNNDQSQNSATNQEHDQSKGHYYQRPKLNVGTSYDQQHQSVNQYANSSSSKYTSNKCRSVVRSSSSFDSTKYMVNVALYSNPIRQHSSLQNQITEQRSAQSSVFHSHEKISSITFDSYSQNYNDQIWIDRRVPRGKPELKTIESQQRNKYNQASNYNLSQAYQNDLNQNDQQSDQADGDSFNQNQCQPFEIFDNYNESLEIMDCQQFDRITNKTSKNSQKSKQRRYSEGDSQRDQKIQHQNFNQTQQQHAYSNLLDDQDFIAETDQLNSDSTKINVKYINQNIGQQYFAASYQTNFEKSSQFEDNLDSYSQNQNIQGLNSNQNHEINAVNSKEPQIYLNSARKQIQMQMDTLKAFCQDKRKIKELMTHCLYSIYRQQDLNQYFDEMVSISKLMRDYYLDSQNLTSKQLTGHHSMQQAINKQLQVGLSMTTQLQQQMQLQVQPNFLRDMIKEIIAEIMKSICEQILAKMKYLGIIVKEPLFRRASYDDFSLCFDYFSRKNANTQNLIQGSSFGLSLGNYGVFTNNIELKNLNQQGNNYDQDDSSLSGFSQCLSQKSQQSSSKQEELSIQEALKKKKQLLGGICQGQSSGFSVGGLNTQLHLAFKQQQEMYLDNGQGYEFIRQEGKRSTWRDIRNSRTRLQHFIYRQQEYKQAFDMIMRSYYQLKNSLEHLEEFWLFLFETIYDKYQHGKLQFDKIWKNLFLEKILDNHYIKNFLNDVSDQYDSLQNYNQQMQQMAANSQSSKPEQNENHRYILDEIYENLIKLENDLNEDYIMNDLSKLINMDDYGITNDSSQSNQYPTTLQQSNSLNLTNTSLNLKALNQQQSSLQQYSDDLYNSVDFQNQNSAVIQQLNLVIANQYELIREKFRLKYNGQTLSQIVHQCTQQGYSHNQTLKIIQESRVKRVCNTSRDSTGCSNSVTIASGSQTQRCYPSSGPLAQNLNMPAPTLTKSQKKRKRKKIQEQLRKSKLDPNTNQLHQSYHNQDNPKIELIQCDKDNSDNLNQDAQGNCLQNQQAKIATDTSKLFRQLMKKSAEIKKMQKENAKNKDKKQKIVQEQASVTSKQNQYIDAEQKVTSLQQQQEGTSAEKDIKLSKKQKLNQKKKRQRVEKKKRIQLEQEEAEQKDNNLIGSHQTTLLEMYKLDPQEFMQDTQLKLLIGKYDPAMNQQDVEYLMQHDDREAVINTLYTKLMERDQINMQLFKDNPALIDQYHDIIDDQDIYYEDELDGNYASSLGAVVTSRHSQYDKNSSNQNYDQQYKYYYNTQDKSINYEKNNLINTTCNQLQVQNWQQKIQQNIEILDQVEFEAVAPHEKSTEQKSNNSQSNISLEQELYDSEFETELQLFQKKLQPSSRECSIERIYLSQQSKKNGCNGRYQRKLVPNISKEWIEELKKEIEEYNHRLNKSLDQRIKQIKYTQENKLQNGEKSSNSDKFRSPSDKNNPYADVGDSSVTDAKQRLSLPYIPQKYNENCYNSQGAKKPQELAESYQRNSHLGGLDVFPQKSGGVAYPFQGCTTNSTEGHSFNSPRANDQIYCYDEVEEVEKNQLTNKQVILNEDQTLGAAAIFMNGTDCHEFIKVKSQQIDQIDQCQQRNLQQNSNKQHGRGNTEKKKAIEKQKNKPNKPKRINKKNSVAKNSQPKSSTDQQPLSA